MKPILFNMEMVRAILDGRKTQTRRPIKSPSGLFHVCWRKTDPNNKWVEQVDENEMSTDKRVNPPYDTGDILYVRETWKAIDISFELLSLWIQYQADKNSKRIKFEYDRFHKFKKYHDKNGWQPNIFMPKEAARIFLKVTDVRVERLQDIASIEAGKEGFGNRAHFIEKWNEIYSDKGYGWDDNPFVWVIEFEVMDI